MFEKITNYIKKQTKWFWITILVTVLVDAINTTYFQKTQSFFYDILKGKDVRAIYSLIGIYSSFIVLLIIVGMMSSYKNKFYRPGKQKFFHKAAEYLTIIMIFGYGIIMIIPASDILGIADRTSVFSENQQNTFLMILIALFFVMVVFAFIEFKTRFVLGKQNYLYVYLFALILATLFVDFSTAMWKYQLFDPEKVADPNRTSRFIEFIAIFPLYAMFYSAPRFILLRKSYSVLPVLSAVFSTAYFVWESLAYLEL